MFKNLFLLSCVVASIMARPGYDFHGYGLSPFLPAPVYSSPIVKALPSPIYAAPVIKAPLLAPAPVPVYKTFAPVAPVIKTVAPTSYASITSFHVAHPAPVIKTIVAPQPILKSYYPAALALGHGYH